MTNIDQNIRADARLADELVFKWRWVFDPVPDWIWRDATPQLRNQLKLAQLESHQKMLEAHVEFIQNAKAGLK